MASEFRRLRLSGRVTFIPTDEIVFVIPVLVYKDYTSVEGKFFFSSEYILTTGR